MLSLRSFWAIIVKQEGKLQYWNFSMVFIFYTQKKAPV